MQLPNPLDGIPRVSSIKILGVTVSNHLSVSEHVSAVIGRCAQTIHALRILRSHGLCNKAIHRVYKSVIIGKLLYAVSAWWGFPLQLTANDCKKSYTVASVVAYVPRKHPLYQIWQNPLMTLFSNASCTTHTMLYTTCSLLGANFLTLLDKGITTDN